MAIVFDLEVKEEDKWFLDKLNQCIYTLNIKQNYFKDKHHLKSGLPLQTAIVLFYVKNIGKDLIYEPDTEKPYIIYKGKKQVLNQAENELLFSLRTLTYHTVCNYESVISALGSTSYRRNMRACSTTSGVLGYMHSIQDELRDAESKNRYNMVPKLCRLYEDKSDIFTVLPKIKQLMLENNGYYNPFYARVVLYLLRYSKNTTPSAVYDCYSNLVTAYGKEELGLGVLDIYGIKESNFVDEACHFAKTHDINSFLHERTIKNKLTEGVFNSKYKLKEVLERNSTLKHNLDFSELHTIDVMGTTKETRLGYKVKGVDDVYITIKIPHAYRRSIENIILGITYKGYNMRYGDIRLKLSPEIIRNVENKYNDIIQIKDDYWKKFSEVMPEIDKYNL